MNKPLPQSKYGSRYKCGYDQIFGGEDMGLKEENERLKARVEELEGAVDEETVERWKYVVAVKARHAVEEERDELRTRLESERKARHNVVERNGELSSRLASYEKPAPTIVKQTWQGVYTVPGVIARTYTSEPGIPIEPGHFEEGKLIAKLRVDYYSDGIVKAELEPTGESK